MTFEPHFLPPRHLSVVFLTGKPVTRTNSAPEYFLRCTFPCLRFSASDIRAPYSAVGPLSVSCLSLPCFHLRCTYLSTKTHQSLPAVAELSPDSGVAFFARGDEVWMFLIWNAWCFESPVSQGDRHHTTTLKKSLLPWNFSKVSLF